MYTSRTVDALEHCWLRVVAVKPKGCAPMVKRVYTPCEWACTWNFEGLRPHTPLLPVAPRAPRRQWQRRAAPAHDPRARDALTKLHALIPVHTPEAPRYPLTTVYAGSPRPPHSLPAARHPEGPLSAPIRSDNRHCPRADRNLPSMAAAVAHGAGTDEQSQRHLEVALKKRRESHA